MSEPKQPDAAPSRQTDQRQAVRDAIEHADRPLRVAEILDAARCEVPSLGQATVYRVVKRGLDEGWLKLVEMPGNATLYEPAGKHHHHHFECTRCKRVFEVEGCPGRAALNRLAPPGFSVESHDLTLYGTCDQCRHDQPPNPDDPPSADRPAGWSTAAD